MKIPDDLDKSRIKFVGDCHGKIAKLNEIAKSDSNCLHIQLGDMGVGFGRERHKECREPKLESNIRFFRGNHDNPNKCRERDDYLGDFGLIHYGSSNIAWISGGMSIDVAFRIPGRSWWFDEELNERQFQNSEKMLLTESPDIMLSHEGPSSVCSHLLSHHLHEPSVTSLRLERFRQLMTPPPSLWLFGHHHVSWSERINSTLFQCLAELEVLEVQV